MNIQHVNIHVIRIQVHAVKHLYTNHKDYFFLIL